MTAPEPNSGSPEPNSDTPEAGSGSPGEPTRDADEPTSYHGHPDHPRLERLEDAALEAEFRTGRREESIDEAKQQLWRRAARILGGTLLSLLGLILLVLPGPGLVVLALGLALLAQDIPFAKNLLEQVQRRLPDDGTGKVPTVYIVFMAVSVVFFTSLSLWWTFFR